MIFFNQAERMAQLHECCEQVEECRRQVEEAKAEYHAVTAYLSDMQRIEQMPKPQRAPMEEAARIILNLNKERNRFQKKGSTIPELQYQLFERNELRFPRELEIIREKTEYQQTIESDLNQLEEEKQKLLDRKEESIGKNSFLKWIAISTGVIVLLLFLLFLFISGRSKADMTLPFLLTILMGMGTTVYVYIESRRNQADVVRNERKINRAVGLMNKVRIKSVNNRNYLEYTLGKYMVNSYEQLKESWEIYVRYKDEVRRYQKNTDILDTNHRIILEELKRIGLKDAEVWLNQPTALVDRKEMSGMAESLTERRKKVRERIDQNQHQIEELKNSIIEILKENPKGKDGMMQVLKRHGIEVSI